MTSLSLNELSDTAIDEFIGKFKEDIKQKQSQTVRSPTIGSPTPSQKAIESISKPGASDLPWSIETVFFQ